MQRTLLCGKYLCSCLERNQSLKQIESEKDNTGQSFSKEEKDFQPEVLFVVERSLFEKFEGFSRKLSLSNGI